MEIKKEQVRQEVFDLYDDYAHNRLSRRDFMEKLSAYAAGAVTVPALMSFLMPDYKNTLQVRADDPRLQSEYINYSSPKGGGTIKALLSRPVDKHGVLGGIVVVHENRGLNPYIEDVARRAALAGFITIAPDALTPLGGYPGNDDKGREMQSKRNKDEMLEDFIAAYDFLKQSPGCNGRIGVVGFCFGGGIANLMAVRVQDLAAAVPFYGAQPTREQVPQIKAPLLLHYAELDTRVNEGWPAYESALKEFHKEYTAYIYPGVNHGFHNDTTPRYDKGAAELAWQRTIDFFTAKLAGSGSVTTNDFNGSWTPVRQEMAGTKLPAAAFAKQQLIISGNSYTVIAESVDKGEVRFGDGKMDIYGKEGVNNGRHFTAIYKYEQEQLTICYNLAGDSYPASFDTKGKPLYFLSVFKKETGK